MDKIFNITPYIFLICRPTNEFPHPLARVPQNTGYWVFTFVWSLKFLSHAKFSFHVSAVQLISLVTMFHHHYCIVQLSYIIVELLIWWGIRGSINEFRRKKLNLPPIAYFSTYRGSISHLPTAYMWSPSVVPKPKGTMQSLIQLNILENYFFIDLCFYMIYCIS